MGERSLGRELSVREITHADVPRIADYWQHATPDFLRGMGVDIQKMPTREQWLDMLAGQVNRPYADRQSYCLVWLLNGEPVGHSNVNKIIYGQEAYMHLHLWVDDVRKQGLGEAFVRLCIPHFIKNLQLKKLCCEPYAHNPGPNKTLQKLGFTHVKTHITTPGWLNFEQEVNLWELDGGLGFGF